MAAVLIGLAFAAAQPEANSQSRGNSRPSGSSNRPQADISPADRKPSNNKPSANKPSATKPSNQKPSQPAAKPSQPNNKPAQPAAKPADKPSNSKPSGAVSRPSQDKPSVSRPSQNKPVVSRPVQQQPSANKPQQNRPKPGQAPGFRPGNADRPLGVTPPSRYPRQPRVHPRDRDFMDYGKVTFHWSSKPHYYGYRIQTLPTRAIKRLIGGITYYLLDDIWYRPYNGYYIVSRPPFGTSLAANIISDIAWTAVTLSYYNTVANTYNTISENNAYIAQQNAVIAQNNATIAAQNQAIALSQTKAQAAYGLANELGLVQSYGSASASYFYQDGVFYSQGSDGQYYVIVPPAGAIVDRLPEDFDTVILNGNKYYRVDDTIYQMVINEGKPYFEVLGQMN